MTDSEKKFRRNKASKIEKIVHAMADLISERGYEGFSVNDIPEKAELSIGTVYRYFPHGKADILKELMQRNIDVYLQLADFSNVTEGIFVQSLRNFIQSYIIIHREDMILGVAMRTTSSASPELARDLQPIIVSFYQTITEQIKDLSFFQDMSDSELMVKIHLSLNLMGYIREMHERVPLFTDDNALIDYLLHVVLYSLGVAKSD